MDRNQVGSLLVAAGLRAPNERTLVSLLAINGLRISEALGTDIEAVAALERRHRTLTVLQKVGKIVTMPLAPRTARAFVRRERLPTAADSPPKSNILRE